MHYNPQLNNFFNRNYTCIILKSPYMLNSIKTMDDKNYVIHKFHSLNVTGCRKVSVAISGSSCEQILRFEKTNRKSY